MSETQITGKFADVMKNTEIKECDFDALSFLSGNWPEGTTQEESQIMLHYLGIVPPDVVKHWCDILHGRLSLVRAICEVVSHGYGHVRFSGVTITLSGEPIPDER